MTIFKLSVYSLLISVSCSLSLTSNLAFARFGRSQVVMTTIKQPASSKSNEELFHAYVEDGSWNNLKYKNLKTRRTRDTGIDDPLAYAWSGIYLAYVEKDSWQDLEYIDMRTNKKKDTRIDDPSFIEYKNGTLYTNKGNYTFKITD